MRLLFNGGRFEFACHYEDRFVPKEAGFRWDKVARVWYTDNQRNASRLIEYASDDYVRSVLESVREEVAEAVNMSSAADADIEIPAPAGYEYMGFQRAGIAFALRRKGTLIGDEMGLGKTIQAIGVMNADVATHRSLIICPASLKLNWQRELGRWLVRPTMVCLATPKEFPRLEPDWPKRDAVVIVNYDVLYKHEKWIRAVEWDLIVADEAHYIKNPKARRSRVLLGYRGNPAIKGARGPWIPGIDARRVIFMTGTPIVNRPSELWSIIHRLDSETWRSWRDYVVRYCGFTRNRWGSDVSGASNLDELQMKLRSSVLVRRLKKDVLKELPAKRRQVIEIPATVETQHLVARERAAIAANEDRILQLKIAVELAKACEDDEAYRVAVRAMSRGIMTDFTEISKLRHQTALAKVGDVIEHLKELVDEEGVKVVCFAHHKDVIAQIAGAFKGKSVVLTGDTSLEDRQRAVDRFQKDGAIRLFVGSITAAGVGLTLTASSSVVFAELDWVPGNVTQAEDRCHRIGQTDSVMVQHLVLQGSIDATMAETLIAKQEVIEKALDVGMAELASEVMVPIASMAATEGSSCRQIAEDAAGFDAERIQAVHLALQQLAGVCDGAATWDGQGFSKIDVGIGHSLARCARLTSRQAALGARLVRKYRGQFDAGLVAVAMGAAT